MRLIFLTLLFTLLLQAKVIISPFDVMEATFTDKSTVVKKNVLLNKAKASAIENEAKSKLKTKIYRLYSASINDKVVGYGLLLTRKVRTKDVAVLYLFTPEKKIKSAEIIAFHEPIEYLPSQTWLSQFDDVSETKVLRVGKDITTITGATLSARAISDGSRLALAIIKRVVK